MKIEIVQGPSPAFIGMLTSNLGATLRDTIPLTKWGAVGLIQATLIEIYRSADLAEKASDVTTALVYGNCPQHIQMLAIFGNSEAVKTALKKIQNYYSSQEGVR